MVRGGGQEACVVGGGGGREVLPVNRMPCQAVASVQSVPTQCFRGKVQIQQTASGSAQYFVDKLLQLVLS
jgi:hypothetical protein